MNERNVVVDTNVIFSLFLPRESRIEFIDEGGIPIGTWVEAHRLCRDVDSKDAPFVALTLHVDGHLWTADEPLTKGLLAKGFNRLFKT